MILNGVRLIVLVVTIKLKIVNIPLWALIIGKISCRHGYYEWIPDGSYQGYPQVPGGRSCTKFTAMFDNVDRLRRELEELDKAPSI